MPNQICTRAPLYPAAATAPPDTPLELREPFFSPVSPLACLPPASVFERRPFSHSQRSAFRPPAPPAPVPLHTLALPATAQQQPAATSSLQQLKSLLALKMALVQRRRAAGDSLAGSSSGVAAAALLEALTPPTPGTPASPAADEQRRLQLAQKLLLVRAALQARIARKRAALGLEPAAADLPTPQLTPVAMPLPPAGFAAFQLPPRPALPKTADQGLAAFQLRARSSSG